MRSNSSSSSASSSSASSSHRDVGHSFADTFGTDDVEVSLHSRGERARLRTASDVLAVPELAELEDYVREQIRARPLSTLALGAAGGALLAITQPLLGRAPTALIMALAMRAGRRLAWRAAGEAIHTLLTPNERAPSSSQAP